MGAIKGRGRRGNGGPKERRRELWEAHEQGREERRKHDRAQTKIGHRKNANRDVPETTMEEWEVDQVKEDRKRALANDT